MVLKSTSRVTGSCHRKSKLPRPMNSPGRPTLASVKPSHVPRPSGYVRKTSRISALGSMNSSPSALRLSCRRAVKEATEAKIARNKPGAPQGAPDEITGERRQRDSAERKPRFARVDRRLDEVERAPILRRADEA